MIYKWIFVAVIFLAVGGKAQAEPLTDLPHNDLLEELKPQKKEEKQRTQKLHIVTFGDTLVSIGKEHKVSYRRLYDANKAIKYPDIIYIGQKIKIPSEKEKLESRKIPVSQVPQAIDNSTIPSTSTGGKLTGSIGYAKCVGNCVNTAKAHGKNQLGNPDTWVATTQTPFIGAAALFKYQHVGIVVGIWENGDLEIAHENYCGGQHRFSPSEFRGYF